MRYEPPKWVFVYVCAVAAFVLWAASCKGLATMGGAGAGAGVGAAVGGPLGAVVGGAGGAAAGDMLVQDEPTSVTNVTAQPGSTVHVAASTAAAKPWWMNPWLWVAGFAAFRFRAGIAALARTLFTGGFSAAASTLAGLVLGGKVADHAKESVAMHMARRRRAPPAVVVSSENKPHE